MEKLSSSEKAYIRSLINYKAAVDAIAEIRPDIWKTVLLKQQMDVNAEFPIPQYATMNESLRVITERLDKMVEIIQASVVGKDLDKFQDSAATKADRLNEEFEQLVERHELIRKLNENLDKDLDRFDQKINIFNI